MYGRVSGKPWDHHMGFLDFSPVYVIINAMMFAVVGLLGEFLPDTWGHI